VQLAIFNVAGQLVRALENGYMHSGVYSASWDGKDDSGKDASSGVYLYQLKTADKIDVRRMLLLR